MQRHIRVFKLVGSEGNKIMVPVPTTFRRQRQERAGDGYGQRYTTPADTHHGSSAGQNTADTTVAALSEPATNLPTKSPVETDSMTQDDMPPLPDYESLGIGSGASMPCGEYRLEVTINLGTGEAAVAESYERNEDERIGILPDAGALQAIVIDFEGRYVDNQVFTDLAAAPASSPGNALDEYSGPYAYYTRPPVQPNDGDDFAGVYGAFSHV